jgi:LEA14-like dessication related protein
MYDTLEWEMISMSWEKPYGLVTALLAVLVLGGCAGGMYQQPQVTLQNIQLGSLGLRGGTMLVNIKVVNPNRFALQANTLNYDLRISDTREPGDTAWIDFASGRYDQPFSVGARDSATVQIPVEFTYGGLGGATATVLRTGMFDYSARGTVDVRTPIGPYTVPFQRRGSVSVLGAVR